MLNEYYQLKDIFSFINKEHVKTPSWTSSNKYYLFEPMQWATQAKNLDLYTTHLGVPHLITHSWSLKTRAQTKEIFHLLNLKSNTFNLLPKNGPKLNIHVIQNMSKTKRSLILNMYLRFPRRIYFPALKPGPVHIHLAGIQPVHQLKTSCNCT